MCTRCSCRPSRRSRLSLRPLNATVVAVYRPGSRSVTQTFLNDFSDLLERLTTLSAPLMIVSDFNIHVDDSTDIQAGKLHDIIASHSLHQRVTSPTHTQGHTLDLVITHDNQTISVHPVYPQLLSMFVVADCDCLSPSMESASTRQVRNWRALHVDTFAAELQCSELVATPPSDVGSDNVMCISLSACLFSVNCTMCIQEYAAVRIIKRRGGPVGK